MNEQTSEEMIPISVTDKLPFNCAPSNSCFNECCRNLNLFLTPYDVLRLKRRLNLPSREFLRKYTTRHTGPETGLPVVTFKPDPHSGYACPFVTEEGCSVYDDRPAACRMYPLARAVTRCRKTGEITEHFAVIREGHCRGFGKGEGQPVRQWLASQAVKPYNEMNDRLMEIISLKNTIRPGNLEGRHSDSFYLACYDLDAFREAIVSDHLPGGVHVRQKILKTAETDDTALLILGLEWIKFSLFGKPMDNRE